MEPTTGFGNAPFRKPLGVRLSPSSADFQKLFSIVRYNQKSLGIVWSVHRKVHTTFSGKNLDPAVKRLVLAAFVAICLSNVNESRAQVLQGGVQHDQILPPVPSALSAGASFNSEMPVTNVIWYQIPRALGGKFQTTFSHGTMLADFTGRNQALLPIQFSRSVQSYGRQLDALGQCWDCEMLPYIQPWHFGLMRDRQVVIEKHAIWANNFAISLHVRSVDATLAPIGSLILKTIQLDAIKTITVTPKGFAVHDDVMSYSGSGRPLRSYLMDYKGKRIEDFHPTDFERGIDLRKSLADYLRQNGREDLIPVQPEETKPNE